ncbi:MAG: ATP-binding cassette domain-containing protein [Clostridia bacterium]|nr:ATP-binding cassette domain-containing protein [Clostridia bacterium]MDD4386150.1 ATP-binding cassette domain-containing protein [Clostridia bacterium]
MEHGKSTLFRCILNIIPKDKGEALLDNNPINYSILDRIGYLIEEGSLTPEYTVYNQFCTFGILKNMSDNEIIESLLYWLKKFDMLEYLNMKIKNISKGNRQKLQFIVSVLHNPTLLILDEPFSGLDPISVDELKSVILELKKDGRTIVFSSHQMEHVELICDDILLLDKGNMILYGDLNEIKNSYNKKKISVVGKIDIEKLNNENIFKIVNDKFDTYEIYVNGSSNVTSVLDSIKLFDVQNINISNLSLEDIFMDKAGIKYEE